MSTLQVTDNGKPKGNTAPVPDERPPEYLPAIPNAIDLNEKVDDNAMADLGKRHMVALLNQSGKQDMKTRANMRLHLEIASAVVSAGHSSIKLSQEAETGGLVADGVSLLAHVFKTINGTMDNPLVNTTGATTPKNLDIGDAPDDFEVKPGETAQGTHDLDPSEFIAEPVKTT